MLCNEKMAMEDGHNGFSSFFKIHFWGIKNLRKFDPF